VAAKLCQGEASAGARSAELLTRRPLQPTGSLDAEILARQSQKTYRGL
jgi:hypothetical protein